jgi:hypothetical protein
MDAHVGSRHLLGRFGLCGWAGSASGLVPVLVHSPPRTSTRSIRRILTRLASVGSLSAADTRRLIPQCGRAVLYCSTEASTCSRSRRFQSRHRLSPARAAAVQLVRGY